MQTSNISQLYMFRKIFVFWRKCCWFLSAAFMNFVEMRKKSAARCLSWGYETRVQAQNPKPQVAQAHMDRW